MCNIVRKDLKAIGEIECEWEMFDVNHDRNNLIGIYREQVGEAKRLIEKDEAVPSNIQFAVFRAISKIFGYMVTKNTKYGVLSTFNQNWYLKHEGDGRLFVSPTVYCNTKDYGTAESLGYVRAQFFFLQLLLTSEARIFSNLVQNLKLSVSEGRIDPENHKILFPGSISSTKTMFDTVQLTNSQFLTEKKTEYVFNLRKLGPCIGQGATGTVRVYRDYFDGQVNYPTIAIKFGKYSRIYCFFKV